MLRHVLLAAGLLGCGTCAVAQGPRSAAPHLAALLPMSSLSSATRLATSFGLVTSTFRTVEHNRAVGGVPNSYHLAGRAIDIARRYGVTHAQIVRAFQQAGYRMVEALDEGDHTHLAFTFGPVPTDAAAVADATRWHVAPEVPPAPPPLRLLADHHGQLVADLQTGPRLSAR